MRKFACLILYVLIVLNGQAQSVAINTTGASPNASAMLDVSSTTKGVLISKMTTTQVNAIVNPANGLMVYNTTLDQVWINTGTMASPQWQTISDNSAWGLVGNSGTNSASNFIGTADNQRLIFKTNNIFSGALDPIRFNSFFGYQAGIGITTGKNNVAMGVSALYSNQTRDDLVAVGDSALFNNDAGTGFNTAVGSKAGYNTTNGNSNSFFGSSSGYGNTTGDQNTAIGTAALLLNSTGNGNSALGYQSLYNSTTSSNNTAYGSFSLYSNTTGYSNIAIGHAALYHNTDRGNLVAIGDSALFNNGIGAANPVFGKENTAVGTGSLYGNNIGSDNTAVGTYSLYGNTAGSGNTALGNRSLQGNNGYYNTAVGAYSLLETTGSYNQAIGYEAMRHNQGGLNNTAFGNQALFLNDNGIGNISVGNLSMYYNLYGSYNVSVGFRSLFSNTTEDNNVAIGDSALYLATGDVSLGLKSTAVGAHALRNNTTGYYNTGVGYKSLESSTTGSRLTALGYGADVTSSSIFNSTVIGYNATVSSSNTMSFGNSSVTEWAFGISTAAAGHALEVGSTASNGNGAYLTTGGTWTNTSDINKKEDFSAIDGNDLLKKITQLFISKWKYKGTNEYHIGPTAQQFYQLFNVGNDDKTISTVDPSGIALVAIKELKKENDLLKERLQRLEEEINQLKKIVRR